jgi:Zn-finger nucleic acid-binding protein
LKNLACPKCVGPLRFAGEPRGPIATCYDCWGIWIDTPYLTTLREKYPIGNTLYKATEQLKPDEAEATDLLCPACTDGKLVRQKIRGVELEWCDSCRGIYLDQGERERLLDIREVHRAKKIPVTPSIDFGSATHSGADLFAAGAILEGLAGIIGAIWD